VSSRTGTGWRAAMSTNANRRQSVIRTRRRRASRSTEAAQGERRFVHHAHPFASNIARVSAIAAPALVVFTL
jgi:hypothetical protein